MDTNMKTTLCEKTMEITYKAHPGISGCILYSDRGTQYTSERYRNAIKKFGILQSMNSAGGRCHDNARCESIWAKPIVEDLLPSHEKHCFSVTIFQYPIAFRTHYVINFYYPYGPPP